MVNPGSLPAVPTQTWHVLVARIDKTGGTVDIWLDRLASTTPDTSDTGITYAPNPGPGDNFQIADTGESDFIHQHMLLAHAVLYNQALSVEDIDSLLQRIESDYGLSLIAA